MRPCPAVQKRAQLGPQSPSREPLVPARRVSPRKVRAVVGAAVLTGDFRLQADDSPVLQEATPALREQPGVWPTEVRAPWTRRRYHGGQPPPRSQMFSTPPK